MAVTRPTKEGGATTYQGKVSLGFPDILASEMDADLDTIYAAWNGGVGTANLGNGSVTYAKLAPDAQMWSDTGTALTLGPNFVTRQVQWGNTGTVKHSLGDNSGTLQVRANYVTAPTDATKAQWIFALNPTADVAQIFRSPPGATAVFAETLKLDANAVTVSAGILQLNSGGRMLTVPNLAQASVNEVGVPGQDTTKPAWKWGADAVNDRFFIQRAPANTTGFLADLTLDTSGNLAPLGHLSTGGATGAYTLPGVRITGTGAGIRCQGVGTAVADGFSDAIAFGWDTGTSKVLLRVDTTVIGSVNTTAVSDERLKRDVQEDVPGLAAVCALRPISFVYDQTTRDLLPAGRQYGLIAQEAQAHVPAVIEDDGSEAHWLGLDYRLLVPVLIRAIQELAQKVA